MNTVMEFCNNLTDIMVDLRFLRGLDENKVYKLKDDLQKLIVEWKDKDYIPKILCGNFMDFSLEVDICASMYKDSERDKILQFGDEIHEMMGKCVNVDEGYEYVGSEGELADGKNNIAERLLSHYDEFLGNYTGAQLYKNEDGASIQILEYENVFEGCKTYMSFGVSNFSGHIHNKCEIVLNVDDDFDRASCLFANVLMYLIENKVHFYKGSYIGGISAFDEDFCAEHKKAGIYITEAYPFPEEFLLCDDIKIYMCFFVSGEELEYLKKHGSDSFEDYLEENQIDIMELNRDAVKGVK